MNNTSLKTIRHTAAEVLAYAVYDLFPGITLLGGETSDIGFSYDFIADHPITPEVVPLIEERMRAIAKQDLSITFMDMMRTNAVEFFKHHKMTMLVDRLHDVEDQMIRILKIEKFYDIAHAICGETTREAGVVKLLSVETLSNGHTRISGTAFSDKQGLKDFLKKLDRSKGFDFATLGPQLKLCVFADKGSAWFAKGIALREILVNFFVKELKIRSFEEIFSQSQAEAFSWVFKSHNPVERDLPLRYYQTSSESLITQVFCREGQLSEEIISSLQFFDKMVNIFGFRYHYVLCPTRAKNGGSLKNWGKSVDLLVQSLKSCDFPYETDQQNESSNGPRIEVCLIDKLGKRWVGPSLGIDLSTPERLKLAYKTLSGSHKQVEVLYSSIFESLERLIALLVENFEGNLPFWLAPEQVRVVPLAEANFAYARQIAEQLNKIHVRVQTDVRQGALGEKIHAAVNEKLPYIVIVGEKEEKSGTISVRLLGQKENRSGIRIDNFLEQLEQEIVNEIGVRKSIES